MTTMISPERLAELRAMPYEEYLQTPEWLATRKRILRRDHYQCQGCHAKNVVLNIHHYTYERLGCEEDNDLVTLCEACHTELHRLLTDPPRLTFLQKCGVGVGAAAIGTIGMEGFLHAPLPAEIGVLIGAYLLAKNSPTVYATLKEMLPAEVLAWLGQGPEKRQEWSWIERWSGKHLRVQPKQSALPTEEEVETELAQMQDEAFEDTLGEDDDLTQLALGSPKRMTVFSDLLKSGWRPALDKIFIGTDMQGQPLFVAAKDLCHVALAGATGHGKSSLLRLIMAQLCYLKLPVALLNPHYMIFDKDHNEDWTPYVPYLQKDPMDCKDPRNIERVLQWMAEVLLEKRKARTSRGESAGKPFFFILDEYPDIKAEIKKAPEYVGKLLRQGRKYGIFLIVASQDFSVKTLGVEGEGAVRKCFLTTFYVGGDPITAKELLNKAARDIPENDLGRGTIMLKCKTIEEPITAWVPYVDNESLYLLLGPSTYVVPTSQEMHTDELEPDVTTVTVTAQNGTSEHEIEARNGYGYDCNDEPEAASEQAVRGQKRAVTTVTLPPGWTEEKVALLPGFYRFFDELDACLKALEFSTSQRNRDFAREILKQQGLWK